jgi:diguanylate cyclase (GGDEF)-like protein
LAAAHAEDLMSRGNGALPAAAPPAHAHLHDELAHGFWNNATALSWVMSPLDGQLHVSATHAAGEAALAVPVSHEELAGRLLNRVQQDGAKPVRLLEVVPAADGKLHHFLIVGFPLAGVDGLPHPHVAGVAIDITHHKHRIDELAHQALIDGLTGLYNLRGFFLFAEHELRVARRRGTQCAILYIDVDNLKRINDTHGHERGNAVLADTGALLRRAFRECDVIGRLGGDEFAVFAADVTHPKLLRKRLARAVALAATEGVDGLSLSAGVGALPPDPALRLSDLLAAADQAMYKEKFAKLEQGVGVKHVTAPAA